MANIRLDKYLADMQVGTRSQVKEQIRKKLVSVNGVTVTKPDVKVDTDRDKIMVGSDIIGYTQFEYFMLNKPKGVLSAANDPKAQTVVDLITDNSCRDLFPVGRLDKDTEGLMLITNDGELAHKLLSPRKHVDKSYYVRFEGIISDNTVESFAKGIDINIAKCADDEVDNNPEEIYHTKPAKLRLMSADEAVITISEGKFHQIKRMFMAAGCRVTYLKRISMGTLQLDFDLKPGQYRRLTDSETDNLRGVNDMDTDCNIKSADENSKAVSLDTVLKDIKGVIFDMDGTLIDSMHVWRDIDEEFLGSRNLTAPKSMTQDVEGMSIHETAVYFKETFNLPESTEEITQLWNDMAFDRYANSLQLKPYARKLLDELVKRRIKIGIATSNSRKLVTECLNAHGITDMFAAVVTGCDVNHGKPDPEIYLTAAENMGVFPCSCLVFEDVVKGIQAGISAGMTTCAVYDEFSRDTDDEKRRLADYYIDSFEELFVQDKNVQK